MPGFGEIVQKAFYLGVGLASYASEKAGGKLAELRSQVQKLADEMVAKGEMTTEEARRFVEDMMKQAQHPPVVEETAAPTPPSEPRRIEILEEHEASSPDHVEQLRQQVVELQQELKRLQQEP